MNRNEKEAAIASYKALFDGIDSVVICDTSGVSVNTINEVRSKFRAEGITFRVIKNTLAKKALAGTVLEPVCATFHGPVAVALKADDPITPARIVVKSGFAAGAVLDAAGVDSLSKMRNRNEARAALLSVFKASETKFAALIKARAEKFEKEAEA